VAGEDGSVDGDGPLELDFKAFVVLFGGEFCAKFFSLWFFIGDVVSCPGPRVVAGFELFEMAEDVFVDDVVVHDAFVGLIGSDQDADVAAAFVSQETEVSDTALLPLLFEAVYFRAELGELFFLFLAGDFGHFWEVYEFPVADNFFLNVFVVVSGVFLLVFFGFVLFDGFFSLGHKLKYY
jgi:hypothetical protein